MRGPTDASSPSAPAQPARSTNCSRFSACIVRRRRARASATNSTRASARSAAPRIRGDTCARNSRSSSSGRSSITRTKCRGAKGSRPWSKCASTPTAASTSRTSKSCCACRSTDRGCASVRSRPRRTSPASARRCTRSRDCCIAHDAIACFDYAASAPYVQIDMNPQSHRRRCVARRGVHIAAQVSRRTRVERHPGVQQAAVSRNTWRRPSRPAARSTT